MERLYSNSCPSVCRIEINVTFNQNRGVKYNVESFESLVNAPTWIAMIGLECMYLRTQHVKCKRRIQMLKTYNVVKLPSEEKSPSSIVVRLFEFKCLTHWNKHSKVPTLFYAMYKVLKLISPEKSPLAMEVIWLNCKSLSTMNSDDLKIFFFRKSGIQCV